MSPRPQSERPKAAPEALSGLLEDLYRRHLEQFPADGYVGAHSAPVFRQGTLAVYRAYERWLPPQGRVLDWGCRHAPDACLIRARFGSSIALDGCDVFTDAAYPVFFDYAGLRYQPLADAVRLPYPSGSFDAVVAAGVLEHVAMDYESLKEIYRVLKPGARLIITYLPNAASWEEWRLRRRGGHCHRRLYTPARLNSMLTHSGFWPLATGYQTRLDALEAESSAIRCLRRVARAAQVHRLTACIYAVAEKAASF